MTAVTHKQVVLIRRYVDKIRNINKHKYACAYYEFRRGLYAAPDYADFGLAYMAAQAVRMNIDAIIDAPPA